MRTCLLPTVLLALLVTTASAQTESGWTQLSLATCGVDRFLAEHPEANGKGVVIAVLDTGVDPSIPGLTRTPDGEVKVIDVQDFTGDGDVELAWLRLDREKDRLIREDKDGNPIEYEPPQLADQSRAEEREWWFGLFKEAKFVNSDQPDLNGNDTTDDEFPVLVTHLAGEADDYAICFVDTNLDRSFADEQPLRNYRLNFDTFTLHREQPEKEIVPLTFAVNIFLRKHKVVIHFDNGAHGTHVAGIAAGYHINNQAGFNGVAPGAKLMSLKIGCGYLTGISVTESKKQALKYAAQFSRDYGVPVVCNLSYGVESEIEGHSDIDKFVNEILRENPTLVFCTSAGNSGPGLSTVGTPAAATEAITIAAMMAADTARDVVGWSQDGPVITVFSSRGGELDKPDFATPGWATSTVPRYVRGGDFWAGTSMASPYAAGLCANLISYAKQKDPGLRVRAWDVRRALQQSAVPVPGFTVHDYGYGMADLPKAAELLDRILPGAQDDPLINYEVTTVSPTAYKGQARTAYWRGTWFPIIEEHERQTFTIEPIFGPTVDMATRTAFSRKFELHSRTPWCIVQQESVYLRSEQDATVQVQYDAAQLTEPGMHIGIVDALHDGLIAFRLVSTIIVPHRVDAGDNYTRTFKDRLVKGWVPDRYFVAVPPTASSMKITLSVPEGQESRAYVDGAFDPFGKLQLGGLRLNTRDGIDEVERVLIDDLCPGVWELPVVADRADQEWPYDLKVQFYGVHAQPTEVTTGGESKPSGEVVVTNMFEDPLRVKADGEIEGFRLHKEDKFKGLKDELTYNINLDGRFNRLRLDIELAPENYAETTDIAVLVKDSSGEAIFNTAFEDHHLKATLSTRGNTSLTVAIHAGFALVDHERETPISVNIDQLFASPVGVEFSQNGDATIDLIPNIPYKLEFEAKQTLEDIPDGHGPVGFLRLRERASDDIVLKVPVVIGD